MATIRKKQDLVPDPLVAETYAALQAAIFGSELGLRRIILEGDASKVVKAVQSTVEDLNCFGMLVSDIRLQLQNFEHWSIRHIHRL